MKYLQLLLAAGCLSLLLSGCDSATESSLPANASLDSGQKKTSESSQESLRLKIKKGNLWLAVQQNDSMLSGLGPNTSPLHLPGINTLETGVKSYFRSAETQGKFDLKKIRQKKGKLAPFIMSAFIAASDVSSKTLHSYQEAGEKIKAMTPAMPELDQAGEKYIQSVVALSNSFAELRQYYRISEAYKLDDFKQSADLHKHLSIAYQEYQQAQQAMKRVYAGVYEEIHQQELVLIKERGMTITHDVMLTLDTVSDINQSLITVYEAHGDLNTLNESSFEQQLKQLETLYQQLMQNKDKLAEIKKEGLKENYFEGYLNTLPGFMTNLKVMLRDKNGKNDRQLLESLQNKVASIVRQYNNLIGA